MLRHRPAPGWGVRLPMSDLVYEAPVADPTAPVLQRLSFLPVWIVAAMVIGIGAG